MYVILQLRPDNTDDFAAFLDDLYSHHWSLTSRAYQREPDSNFRVHPRELLEELAERKHVATFLLMKDGRIISSMRVTRDRADVGKVIFSHVETHPDFQKRGIFALALGEACLRMVCESDSKRIEITSWSFNRKGIPLYKRYGFRAVPGTNLLMENYLPSIIKHPKAQQYFARHDYIRTLRNERSYGHDAVESNGLSLFVYRWLPRDSNNSLYVAVDWQHETIVDVKCRVNE